MNEPEQQPQKGRVIQSTMTTVDMSTGEEKQRPFNWHVLPPPAHLCQVCAHEHDPLEPHNRQQVFYLIMFANAVGRPPTWADAIAHCDAATQAAWRAELTRCGAWSEPPEGIAPVAHLGDKT